MHGEGQEQEGMLTNSERTLRRRSHDGRFVLEEKRLESSPDLFSLESREMNVDKEKKRRKVMEESTPPVLIRRPRGRESPAGIPWRRKETNDWGRYEEIKLILESGGFTSSTLFAFDFTWHHSSSPSIDTGAVSAAGE
jgi:hypothetical protein